MKATSYLAATRAFAKFPVTQYIVQYLKFVQFTLNLISLIKIKCYTDMFIACVAYEKKYNETRKLDIIKDKYEDELKKLNYHHRI